MKRNVTILVAVLAIVFIGNDVCAQDLSLDLTYASMYVWRGAVFAEDGVFQPSFSGGMGNLSVNLWGNMDLTDENGTTRQMNEWDYTVDYSTAFDCIGVSGGIIGYTFPNSGGPGTTEFYLGASYDIVGAPSITIYRDVEAVNATYVSIAGGLSIPVAGITVLDVNGALGSGSAAMNRALYGNGASGAGLSDVLVGLSVPVTFTEMFTITPSLMLTSILDSDGEDSYDAAGADATNVVIGLTASAAF